MAAAAAVALVAGVKCCRCHELAKALLAELETGTRKCMSSAPLEGVALHSSRRAARFDFALLAGSRHDFVASVAEAEAEEEEEAARTFIVIIVARLAAIKLLCAPEEEAANKNRFIIIAIRSQRGTFSYGKQCARVCEICLDKLLKLLISISKRSRKIAYI